MIKLLLGKPLTGMETAGTHEKRVANAAVAFRKAPNGDGNIRCGYLIETRLSLLLGKPLTGMETLLRLLPATRF